MAELLLEFLSEEIPARMQARATEDLKRLVTEKLTEAGLTYTKAEAFATPRRLALVVDGLATETPEAVEEKRGPRDGAPDAAIQGFLKGAGLGGLDRCEKRDTGKGVFWFAKVVTPGRRTAELLPAVVAETIKRMPWPKSMRWAGYRLNWVRPLQGVVVIFDGALVPVTIELGGEVERRSLESTDRTVGHRFLAPAKIAVAGIADYKRKLKEAYVILDPAERRAKIVRQTEVLAKEHGLTVRRDDALLDEVTGLVEWPAALAGQIDEAFMGLPAEVLTTAMRAHQKYFALLDKDGKLAPRFIVVANIETKDGGKAIVAGNERVLRARLADAKFFWDQDRKIKLEERVPALKNIVFHAVLGTMADKVGRVQMLAAELAPHVPGADLDRARSAALLAKADLNSGMVGEFPELQGVMGRYYALAEGERSDVADAIAEHYAPQGPSDRCPSAPVSVAVALADKIDTLVGFFTVGEKPTGSKDPFALRRAALGVIRLIIENQVRLPLRQIVAVAFRSIDLGIRTQMQRNAREEEVRTGGTVTITESFPLLMADIDQRGEQLASEIMDFLADRLKVALKEKGVRHDLIAAIFALGGEDDLVRLLARVEALRKFLDGEDGANLLTASKRATNIVRIEEKKDARAYDESPDPALLRQDEERALDAALADARGVVTEALAREDFAGAMSALARLRRPVDAFFDRVTVNCEEKEIRANRLRILSRMRSTLGLVADFSKIEG